MSLSYLKKRAQARLSEIREAPSNIFKTPVWAARFIRRNAREAIGQVKLALKRRPFKGPFNNPSITMAVIMDEFTYECFKYECRTIKVTPRRFRAQIRRHRPDFLFVESAWRGNNEAWRNAVMSNGSAPEKLQKLVYYCRDKKIPTVFWNKEDPVHFDHFIETAKLFDYVFTTAEEAVGEYRKRLDHDRVYTLMFAAQPKLHRPVRGSAPAAGRQYLNNVCFAGTYYAQNYTERGRSFEMFADAALRYGLDIYDRNSKLSFDKYRFPDKYRESLKDAVSFEAMSELYKRYKLFININSISGSNTMFARRVFELLACNTCVLSSPSVGMERLFGGIVKVAGTQDEADEFISKVLGDREYRDRLHLRGFREVARAHTYRHRFNQVCGVLRLAGAERGEPGVTVIASPAGQSAPETLLQNYLRQTFRRKELLVFLPQDDPNRNFWREAAALHPDIRLDAASPREAGIEKCLQHAGGKATHAYLAYFAEGDYYAPEYLADLMLYFEFTDAAAVGKKAHYAHDAGSGTLALLNGEEEQTYVDSLAFRAAVVRKGESGGLLWTGSHPDTATVCQADKRSAKHRLYAADRFNYAAAAGFPAGIPPRDGGGNGTPEIIELSGADYEDHVTA